MNVIILEDEPLAISKIMQVINKNFTEIKVVGTAQSIADAKPLVTKLLPDALLCDIHLADGLSFKLLKDVQPTCPTIFITAYDEYALQSFEHNCLDYVLKPINEEKLVKSLQKALDQQRNKNTEGINPQMIEELLKQYEQKPYKKRFICKIGSKVFFKNAEDIACFFVSDKVVFMQDAASGKKFIVSYTLEELEQQYLDPSRFYRINRSAIINLEHLTEMKRYNNGRLKLFTGQNEMLELIVARERVTDFKEWINQ